jgi:hypothetical protein
MIRRQANGSALYGSHIFAETVVQRGRLSQLDIKSLKEVNVTFPGSNWSDMTLSEDIEFKSGTHPRALRTSKYIDEFTGFGLDTRK